MHVHLSLHSVVCGVALVIKRLDHEVEEALHNVFHLGFYSRDRTLQRVSGNNISSKRMYPVC